MIWKKYNSVGLKSPKKVHEVLISFCEVSKSSEVTLWSTAKFNDHKLLAVKQNLSWAAQLELFSSHFTGRETQKSIILTLVHKTTNCKGRALGQRWAKRWYQGLFFLANGAATEAMRAKRSDRLGRRIRAFMGPTVAHVSDKLQALCTSPDSQTEQRCGGIKPCGRKRRGWRGLAASNWACRWLSGISVTLSCTVWNS